MPTSVGSLRCGQWGTQARVCALANRVVGVHLFFCHLRVRLLSCRQLRVCHYFCCMSIDAQRDGKIRLT